jgi:uncharacterized protein
MEKIHQQVILDTGALVALIDRREPYHEWATNQVMKIQPPLITCEAVISEAVFLLRHVHNGIEALKGLLDTRSVRTVFQLDSEVHQVTDLLIRYNSVPMDFADACLVRMAELFPNSAVLTLDSDFRIYRKNRNQIVATIAPWN